MRGNKVFLAAFVTVILTANLVTGCAEEDNLQLLPGVEPTPEQLLASVKIATAGIKTFEATHQTVQTMIGYDPGLPAEITMNMRMIIDSPNKKAFVDSTADLSNVRSASNQMYLINDVMYSKTDRSASGETTDHWEKMTLRAEHLQQTWNSYLSTTRLPALLEGAGLSIVGKEAMDGAEVYKTTITPTMERFFLYIGVPAEEIDDLINGSHGTRPQQIGVTIWVNKQTFLPVKVDTTITLISGDSTIMVSYSTTYQQVNQPVAITVPAEALAAVDVTDRFLIPPTVTVTVPVPPTITGGVPPPTILPVPPTIIVTVIPTTVPSTDELKVVQIATIAALMKGNGSVVEYYNEIIPAGGKTGADNDPGKYLPQSTKLKYTITAKGDVIVGAPIPVP